MLASIMLRLGERGYTSVRGLSGGGGTHRSASLALEAEGLTKVSLLRWVGLADSCHPIATYSLTPTYVYQMARMGLLLIKKSTEKQQQWPRGLRTKITTRKALFPPLESRGHIMLSRRMWLSENRAHASAFINLEDSLVQL